MKKVWILIGIVILVALAIVLVVTQTRKEPEKIKIGAILPLTGDFSSHGNDAKKGMDLALEEINSKGAIYGKKVSIIYEDDKMQPEIGVSGFRKLVSIDKVQVITGILGSSVCLAIAPLAEKQNVVLLSLTASSPELTHVGEYFFRIWPSDVFEGKFVAEKTVKELGTKKFAILYVNNDFGIGLKNAFRKEFEKIGGQVLIEESYSQGDTDFRTQLSKIKPKNVEAIYLPGYYQEIAKILVQSKEMGIYTKFLSASPVENPELIKLAGDAAEGLVYARPAFDPLRPQKNYIKFADAFKNKYGMSPGIVAAYGYDAIQIIFLAIEKGGAKGDKIQESMSHIRNFEGTTGTISFDEYGDVIRQMVLFTVKGGNFVPLRD